jgi:hypothetical protein
MSSVAAHFLDDNATDRLDGTLVTYNPIASGALPTATLSSGTGAQISTSRDTNVGLLYTLDATNNVATVKLELSPDGTTYTSLGTMSFAAAVNNTGAIAQLLTFKVPAAWYVKVTVVHAAITSTTYY